MDLGHNPKRRRTDQRNCPHCNRILSYKTFRLHKRLYYNEDTSEWCREAGDSEVSGDATQSTNEEPYPDLECDTCDSAPNSPENPNQRISDSPPLSDAAIYSDSDSDPDSVIHSEG